MRKTALLLPFLLLAVAFSGQALAQSRLCADCSCDSQCDQLCYDPAAGYTTCGSLTVCMGDPSCPHGPAAAGLLAVLQPPPQAPQADSGCGRAGVSPAEDGRMPGAQAPSSSGRQAPDQAQAVAPAGDDSRGITRLPRARAAATSCSNCLNLCILRRCGFFPSPACQQSASAACHASCC